jgi:uncharacterized protein (TIGR04222 family)
MNFLLDNPIASMDGTAFLVLFIVFIVITLAVLAVARATVDSTDRMPIPAIPPQVDPYEIAYLRGGSNELARSVIFSLVQKGFIEVVSGDKTSRLRKSENGADPSGLAEVERSALSWIGSEREAKDVFDKSYGLTETMSSQSTRYELELSRRHFLMPDEWASRIKKYGIAAGFAISGVGGYKIVAALLNGHFNVLFTVFIVIVGFALAMSIGKLPRMTKLGKRYIERLQSAFEGLKAQVDQPQTLLTTQAGSAGIDPLLLSVGVFGTGILAGTAFSHYQETFPRQQSGGGCGSSCGSSCSSGDSGASSCSSGCGGGCGGCS